MASGALPSSRYRAQSLSKYQPKRIGLGRSLWDIRTAPRRSRWALYTIVFILVVLLIPLPGLSSIRELLLGSLLPRFGEPKSTPGRQVLRYVNPLIGTTNGGMLSPGPDPAPCLALSCPALVLVILTYPQAMYFPAQVCHMAWQSPSQIHSTREKMLLAMLRI